MSKSIGLLSVVALLLASSSFAQAPATQPKEEVKKAFVDSLSLRPERLIVDSMNPTNVWLTQSAAVSYSPAGAMKLRLSLAPEAADAKPTKELGTTEIYSRDLLAKPIATSADLSSLADGNYRIVAELFDGEQSIATLSRPIVLASGIDVKRPGIEQRLSKIQGHDSTKATIRYPFDAARVLNIGQRNWNAADLGINQASQPNYLNFAEEIKRSESLLASLEAGKDPLWRAGGETKRHYYFAESNEILPYHVFVPSTWDGKTALPMVFILHGNTRNQDFYFERDEKIIPRLAEKHGFMLVGVFGFHPNGGYNVAMLRRGAAGAGGNRGAGAGSGRGAGIGRGPGYLNGMPTSRIGELSEADTMHVYDLVKAEYPIDPKRTYLFGYSAGANGGYWIAAHYAANWAAVGLGGANTGPDNFALFDQFKTLPTYIYVGENDAGNIPPSRGMVEAMKQHGVDATFKVYPGATHDTAPSAAVADVFDFFEKYSKH